MNGKEFIRRVRKLAKATGTPVRVETHGKGSHKRLWLGDRFTTVQSGEIAKGTLAAMCKQLGIAARDL